MKPEPPIDPKERPRQKLDEETVWEMRARYRREPRVSIRTIAKVYGVAYTTAYYAITGKESYKDI